MARLSTTTLPGYVLIVASLALFTGQPAYGQVPVDDSGQPIASLDNSGREASIDGYALGGEPLTSAQLETLVGPIALYPDDLLAIVLPASTYPLQIVQAARFLQAYESDNSLEPDESWDESVIALLNYPEAIRLLNDDIDWTWQLGEAVIAQQEDIIIAVESFRDRAYAAGNLKSDEHQTVSRNADIIEIDPVEDDIIYVPYYEPEQVVVQQPQRVYYYYDQPRAVYYYPYPSGYAFSSGYFWGVTTAFHIGWASNHLRVHHPSYWGHPYYGHSYSGHNYRRPSISVHNTVYVNNARRYSPQRFRDGDYWRPRRHVGARPSDYYSHARHYRTDLRRSHHESDRHGTQQRDQSSHNSRQTRHRSHSQNEIRFRHRDRSDSLTVRRGQHARSGVNQEQNPVRRMTLTRSSERNREKQLSRNNDRNRHQVRHPQRQVTLVAARQRPPPETRNNTPRPRHQQLAREHSPQRSGGNRKAAARQASNESRRQHDGQSQRRQQAVKQARAPARKSGRTERESHGVRKEHASGRERHKIESR